MHKTTIRIMPLLFSAFAGSLMGAEQVAPYIPVGQLYKKSICTPDLYKPINLGRTKAKADLIRLAFPTTKEKIHDNCLFQSTGFQSGQIKTEGNTAIDIKGLYLVKRPNGKFVASDNCGEFYNISYIETQFSLSTPYKTAEVVNCDDFFSTGDYPFPVGAVVYPDITMRWKPSKPASLKTMLSLYYKKDITYFDQATQKKYVLKDHLVRKKFNRASLYVGPENVQRLNELPNLPLIKALLKITDSRKPHKTVFFAIVGLEEKIVDEYHELNNEDSDKDPDNSKNKQAGGCCIL